MVVRLVEHGEAIQGMREHFLNIPTQRLEEIEEELRVQRERAEVAETERITLHARVRSLKVVETWLRGIVRDEREARARIECQLGLVQEELESLGTRDHGSVSLIRPICCFIIYDHEDYEILVSTNLLMDLKLEQRMQLLQLAKYHAVIVCDEKIVQIKNRPQVARECQKNYADVRRKPLKFQVEVKKCLSDETLAIPLDEIQNDDKLHFIEEPVESMELEVKRLKQSRLPIVNVDGTREEGPSSPRNVKSSFKRNALICFPVP
ncbi:hypothetical protein Tco_0735019 [Tanacetum coccineum]